MKRKEHIIRTSKLIQALLMGYEVTLPQYIISYKNLTSIIKQNVTENLVLLNMLT